jgi:hypothetical protein
MNLTLRIDGQERKFVSSFIPARAYRQVLEMNKRMNFNDLSPDEMDEIVNLIRGVFENQFTVDQFYDGLPVQKLVPTMMKTFETINGVANDEESSEKK